MTINQKDENGLTKSFSALFPFKQSLKDQQLTPELKAMVIGNTHLPHSFFLLYK